MPFLKELSVALGLLTGNHAPVDAIAGWEKFTWHIAPVSPCKTVDGEGFCLAIQEKWDPNSAQTYLFSYRYDLGTSAVVARVRLENKDSFDSDNVCLVAVFGDASGQPLAVFYNNFRSLHGRTIERQFPIYPPFPLDRAKEIAVGTKECEKVNKKDNAAFRAMRKLVSGN